MAREGRISHPSVVGAEVEDAGDDILVMDEW